MFLTTVCLFVCLSWTGHQDSDDEMDDVSDTLN